MAQELELELPEGGSIRVEIAGPSEAGPLLRGGGLAEDELVKTGARLDRVVQGIGPTLGAVVDQLRQLEPTHAEVEVEFSLKVSADANLVIARSGGEANFRVLVRWARDRLEREPRATDR